MFFFLISLIMFCVFFFTNIRVFLAEKLVQWCSKTLLLGVFRLKIFYGLKKPLLDFLVTFLIVEYGNKVDASSAFFKNKRWGDNTSSTP